MGKSKIYRSLFLILFVFCFIACIKQGNYYEKYVRFHEGATLEEKVEIAARLTPTKQQLAWQQLELSAFIHFGINTFTDREWGDGSESPELFNPTEIDTDQWVRILKNAGFKMVILTAKHHDGFCLWPTKTTEHSIANSPWKNGEGDLVADLRESCQKYDVKFGVYLSPWDRNAPSYGSDEYNDLFLAQLTELLTNYGEIHEVWFDGANGEGPNGKKQEYDWYAYHNLIRKLQPNAVTAVMGDDVRWVGNEDGLGRETEWSATVKAPNFYESTQNESLNITSMSDDLGSREMLRQAEELFWFPSEVDVSIRPGWFYHAHEDNKVKSLKELVDIYYKSVGYNSGLLLNIPPDSRGLIHESDSAVLSAFGNYIETSFKYNQLKNGNKGWTTAKTSSKEFQVESDGEFNVILLQEDITKGQRVERFSVDVLEEGIWRTLATGTTVGYKRLLRTEKTKASKVRINIEQSRGKANIINTAAFLSAEIIDEKSELIINELETGKWTVLSPMNAGNLFFDNNVNTYLLLKNNDSLKIDLGEMVSLAGFTYTPSRDEAQDIAYRFHFFTSKDGVKWEQADELNEFSNIENNPITQFVYFPKTIHARYVRFEVVETVQGTSESAIAEIGFMIEK